MTTVMVKRCCKVISHTAKFSLLTIQLEYEQKDIVTTIASSQDLSVQHKHVNKIIEEHKDILTTPLRVPPHCSVKKIYNRALHTPHVAYSLTDSSHTHADHAARLSSSLQQQLHNNLQQAN